MFSAGRVLLMPKGAYNPLTTYEMLDIVSYNGSSYIAKGTTTGNLPTDTTYWQLSAYGGQAANMAGNFAELESSSVATATHYVDDIFVDENSQLMKATQTINIGDTIDANVNCAPTTVEALISSLSSYVDSLDSLNKKIQGAIEIAAQTDLHSLAIGEYYKKQTTFYVTNGPTGIDQDPTAIFRLTVEAALDNASQASSPLLLTLRTPDGKIYTQGFDGTNWGSWVEVASAASVSALNTAKQPKTLDTPITVGGVQQTTVEGALGSINQTLTNETYNVNDTAITEVASDDLLPIYDTSATGKKKIAVSNFIGGLVSNPNLLDNPWFTVNQRGISFLSAVGYTADRWKIYTAGLTFTQNSNKSITLERGASEAVTSPQFIQVIEDEVLAFLDGKTVTLSALINGVVYSATSVIDASQNTFACNISIATGISLYIRIIPTGNPKAFVCFNLSGTSAMTLSNIKAVKLELGTVSTLAMDTAPNYAEELLKCQRYYQRLGRGEWVKGDADRTCLWIVKKFDVPMRAIPTVTIINQSLSFYGMIIDNNIDTTAISKGIEEISADAIGFIQLLITSSHTITSRTIYSANIDFLEASADL